MCTLSDTLRHALLGDFTNKCINPNFSSDAASWVAGNSAVLSAVANGQAGNCLLITNGAAGNGRAYQDFTVKIGQHLFAKGYAKKGTANGVRVLLGTPTVADYYGSTRLLTGAAFADDATSMFSIGAKVQEVTLRVTLEADAGNGLTGYFDTIVVSQFTNGLADAMSGGDIHLFSGTRPSDPNVAPTGTKLLTIPNIHWAAPVNGTISKDPAENWVGNGLVGGQNAGYGVMTEFGDDTSTSGAGKKRIFFTVAQGSGAELVMSSTAISLGVQSAINSATFTLPVGL